MTSDLVPRGAAELFGTWQFVLGALVLTIGPAVAVHRRRLALASLDETDRALAADRRGRRVEDLLTVVIAAAAAALSATGLRRVGHHQMGLNAPFDLLPFVALDVAAMVCGRRARRRARAGEGPGLSGALFWILAGISSVFSAAESDSLLGSAVRAVWPVLAAVLWEVGSLEERRAARNKYGRPDRRIALVRLLHPVEACRVALLLAARQDLAQQDATAEVRISRAAYRWYRLRRTQDGTKQAGGMTRWAYRAAERRADMRAQRASERAGCSDPHVLEQVVSRLQLRVRQADMAGMNLRTSTAFEHMRGTLIPTTPLQATEPHPTPTSHPEPEGIPHVEPGMSEHVPDRGDNGAPENNPSEDPEGDEPASTDRKTDAEVMAAFVEIVPRGDDGTFAWGINRCARELGIGNKRAKRFLDSQHHWLPDMITAHNDTGPDPDHLKDHFDEAVSVANGPQPALPLSPIRTGPALPVKQEPFDELLLGPGPGDGYARLGNGLLIPAAAGVHQS